MAIVWAALVLAWSSLAPPKSPEQLRKEESALLKNFKEYPNRHSFAAAAIGA
jgi:hypothetical protein